MPRRSRLRLALALLAAWLPACGPSAPDAPTPFGAQTLEGAGEHGLLRVWLEAPLGVEGPVDPSRPAYFPLALRVEGPPGGMAHLSAETPHVPGCDLSSHLPAWLPLDEEGRARVEAWVTFWAPLQCDFVLEGRAAARSRVEARDRATGRALSHALLGEVDAVRLAVTFRNYGADLDDPAIRGRLAARECEELLAGRIESRTPPRIRMQRAKVEWRGEGRFRARGTVGVTNAAGSPILHRVTCDVRWTGEAFALEGFELL